MWKCEEGRQYFLFFRFSFSFVFLFFSRAFGNLKRFIGRRGGGGGGGGLLLQCVFESDLTLDPKKV